MPFDKNTIIEKSVLFVSFQNFVGTVVHVACSSNCYNLQGFKINVFAGSKNTVIYMEKKFEIFI